MKNMNQANKRMTVEQAISKIGDASFNSDYGTMKDDNDIRQLALYGLAAAAIVASVPIIAITAPWMSVPIFIGAGGLGAAAGEPLVNLAEKFNPKQQHARNVLHDAAKAGDIAVREGFMDLYGNVYNAQSDDQYNQYAQVILVKDKHDSKKEAAFYPEQLGGKKEAQQLVAEAQGWTQSPRNLPKRGTALQM